MYASSGDLIFIACLLIGLGAILGGAAVWML